MSSLSLAMAVHACFPEDRGLTGSKLKAGIQRGSGHETGLTKAQFQRVQSLKVLPSRLKTREFANSVHPADSERDT